MAAGVDEHEFPLHLYVEERELGGGAFGTVHVYKLRDDHAPTPDRPERVAVKTVRPAGNNRQFARRESTLIREFNILKNLIHVNIVEFLGCYTVTDSQQGSTKIHLVMELCQKDLTGMLEQRGKFTSDDTSYVIKQLLEGLAYLHIKNVIHRDIKPENVLLMTTQEKPNWSNINIWEVTAKLGEFGLAKQHYFDSQSLTLTLNGTPFYMAPEQYAALTSGDTTFRGQSTLDIYPIGVIAHELLTGAKKDGRSGYSNFDELESEFQDTNPLFLSLLKEMLHTDAKQRMSAENLLKHEFIKDGVKNVGAKRQEWQIEQMKSQMEMMQQQMVQMTIQIVQQSQNSQAQATALRQSEKKIEDLKRERQEMRTEMQQMIEGQAVMQRHSNEKIAGLEKENQSIKKGQIEMQRHSGAKIAELEREKHGMRADMQKLRDEQVEMRRQAEQRSEEMQKMKDYQANMLREIEQRLGQMTQVQTEEESQFQQKVRSLEIENTDLRSSLQQNVAKTERDIQLTRAEIQTVSDEQSSIQRQFQETTSEILQMQSEQAETQRRGTEVQQKVDGLNWIYDMELKDKIKVIWIVTTEQVDKDLYDASKKSDIVGMKTALERGANVECTYYGDTPLICAVANDCGEAVKLLIESGADVNKTDSSGRTPLYCAARDAHNDAMCILIQNNAQIDKAWRGWTPLITTASYGNVSTVKILVKNGADLNKRDNEGLTALGWAQRNNKKEVVQILRSSVLSQSIGDCKPS